MMRIAPERLRNDLLELGLYLIRCLTRREAGAVADAEDMRVDGERLLAEGGVEHDVRGLTANTGQRLQLLAGPRHLAIVLIDQRLAECDDVLRLGVEQADRLDGLAHAIFP
ncbi:hypothetical protein GCM10022276_08330 [Sphingomonas limnosediminicola]|uniref:Uncharacterized protein n=1 Tax=Sphingomonas limnosediminicola TaxID=940133 RepID=A0ABP7KYX2_9SPHN